MIKRLILFVLFIPALFLFCFETIFYILRWLFVGKMIPEDSYVMNLYIEML